MDRLLVNSLTTLGLGLSLLIVTGIVDIEPVQASTADTEISLKFSGANS